MRLMALQDFSLDLRCLCQVRRLGSLEVYPSNVQMAHHPADRSLEVYPSIIQLATAPLRAVPSFYVSPPRLTVPAEGYPLVKKTGKAHKTTHVASDMAGATAAARCGAKTGITKSWA
eukprot:s3427_g1.t1